MNNFKGTARIRLLVVGQAAQPEPVQQDLKIRGYLVSWAPDGAEALRILADTTPQLILLDIALGCPHDWELLKAIRALC